MPKNGDSKLGYKKPPSQREIPVQAQKPNKENRSPNTSQIQKNRSLKTKQRKKYDLHQHKASMQHINKESICKKTSQYPPHKRQNDSFIHRKSLGKDSVLNSQHFEQRGSQLFGHPFSGNIHVVGQRRHKEKSTLLGASKAHSKKSSDRENLGKRTARHSKSELTSFQENKMGHSKINKNSVIGVNYNRDNIYEQVAGKNFEYDKFHFKTSGQEIGQSIYHKIEKENNRFGSDQMKGVNFRTMKQVFSQPDTEKSGAMSKYNYPIPGFQRYNIIGSKEVKKSIKRGSISRLEAVKTGREYKTRGKLSQHKKMSKQDLEKFSKKIHKSKTNENCKILKKVSKKRINIESNDLKRNSKLNAKRPNQLNEYLNNLDSKSRKSSTRRSSGPLSNQVSRCEKRSSKESQTFIHGQRKSSKNSIQIEMLASLIKNSNKTLGSVEKLMMQSRKDTFGSTVADESKADNIIFETIYKEKNRMNSKNNKKRKKIRRTSGISSGVGLHNEHDIIWKNESKRGDSSLGLSRVSKRIPNNKTFCKRKTLEVKAEWKGFGNDQIKAEAKIFKKMGSEGWQGSDSQKNCNVLADITNLRDVRVDEIKSEILDIENSLYCKENLKKIGSKNEFNKPINREQIQESKNTSTIDSKTLKNAKSIGEIQREKQVSIGIEISSFFKGSQLKHERDTVNLDSKTIKEETPDGASKLIDRHEENQHAHKNETIHANKSALNKNEIIIETISKKKESKRKNDKIIIETPEKKFSQNSILIFQKQNNFKDILSHHIKNISLHLIASENKCSIKEDYFKKKQKQVDNKMREVLIDWLIEVHNRYRMRDETIFLAVRLIDKYLSLKSIEYNRFQLLGTSSLMIAAKYEEIYPPKVKDFVYICANAYTRRDVLDMESEILRMMNFDLVFPTSIQFFGFLQKIYNFDKMIKHFVHYILYGSLIFNSFIQSNPRLLAYSSVIMANKAFKNYEGIKRFKQTLGYEFKDSDVNYCIFQIYNMLLDLKKSELTALRTRFSTDKYLNIAQIEGRVN